MAFTSLTGLLKSSGILEKDLFFSDLLSLTWKVTFGIFSFVGFIVFGLTLISELFTLLYEEGLQKSAWFLGQSEATQLILSVGLSVFDVLFSISLSLIALGFMFYVVTSILQGKEEHTQGQYLRASWNMFPRMLGLFAYTMVRLMLYALLLIVPAIIFGVRWTFAPYYMLLGKAQDARDAVEQSAEIVKGHWWEVVGRYFGLGVMMFLFMLAAMVPFFLFVVVLTISTGMNMDQFFASENLFALLLMVIGVILLVVFLTFLTVYSTVFSVLYFYNRDKGKALGAMSV